MKTNIHMNIINCCLSCCSPSRFDFAIAFFPEDESFPMQIGRRRPFLNQAQGLTQADREFGRCFILHHIIPIG